jgi:hypothetical protein
MLLQRYVVCQAVAVMESESESNTIAGPFGTKEAYLREPVIPPISNMVPGNRQDRDLCAVFCVTN